MPETVILKDRLILLDTIRKDRLILLDTIRIRVGRAVILEGIDVD